MSEVRVIGQYRTVLYPSRSFQFSHQSLAVWRSETTPHSSDLWQNIIIATENQRDLRAVQYCVIMFGPISLFCFVQNFKLESRLSVLFSANPNIYNIDITEMSTLR